MGAMLRLQRVNLMRLVIALSGVLSVASLGCSSTAASVRKQPDCTHHHAELHKPEVGSDEPVGRALNLERGCQAGRSGDCWTLESSMVSIGQCAGARNGVARDFLERACEARCARACLERAEVVASRWFHEDFESTRVRVTEDLHRAFPFYERACDLGHPRACAYVGWMTRDGIGTPPDPARGTAILERGCEAFRRTRHRGDDLGMACSFLADSYADGRGVPANLSKARELNHVFCGDRLDCGALYLVSSDTARSALWVLELSLVVFANILGLLTFFPRYREKCFDDRGSLLPVVAIAGTLGALAMAIELAYFFWGSSVSSPLWLFLAVPLSVLPLVAGFQRGSRLFANVPDQSG